MGVTFVAFCDTPAYSVFWDYFGPALYIQTTDHSGFMKSGWNILRGVAADLLRAVREGATPVGILLDRLEEFPEECEAAEELTLEAVRWLRGQHPLGV